MELWKDNEIRDLLLLQDESAAACSNVYQNIDPVLERRATKLIWLARKTGTNQSVEL